MKKLMDYITLELKNSNFMNRMRKYIAIIFMSCCCTFAYAQSFSLGSLTNKTWKGVSGYVGIEYIDITFTFSENSMTFQAWQRSDTTNIVTHTYDMYLSDTMPNVFDYSQIGKHNIGHYIVMNRSYDNKGDFCNDFLFEEIVHLSDHQLILKGTNGNTIVFDAP